MVVDMFYQCRSVFDRIVSPFRLLLPHGTAHLFEQSFLFSRGLLEEILLRKFDRERRREGAFMQSNVLQVVFETVVGTRTQVCTPCRHLLRRQNGWACAGLLAGGKSSF